MTFLLALIPAWLKRALAWAVAALVAAAGIFIAGRRDGLSSAKSAAKEKASKDKTAALEVRDEVDQKSGDDVRADLDRWMRD